MRHSSPYATLCGHAFGSSRLRCSNLYMQGYAFAAKREQLRPPRIVRAALVQNAIVEPTTAPFSKQLQAGCLPCDLSAISSDQQLTVPPGDWHKPRSWFTLCRHCTAGYQTS
jgi:hypothetical protein